VLLNSSCGFTGAWQASRITPATNWCTSKPSGDRAAVPTSISSTGPLPTSAASPPSSASVVWQGKTVLRVLTKAASKSSD